MAMVSCEICGGWIDEGEHPEVFRDELVGTPVICEECWETSESLEDLYGDFS